MAIGGSWPTIRKFGLLSTQSLLDLFEVDGYLRAPLLRQRRPNSETINHPLHGDAVIRDQRPLNESMLRRCLFEGTTVEDWYRLLNERVFFCVSEERLRNLLNAGTYKAGEHDVITVDT